MIYDAIVIGGGAAGLFFAMSAGARGKRVLVLESNAEVGRKILISGGGRCNFTNLDVSAENFVSQNPHFCKSALACCTPQDFITLVKKHRIAYYEKTLGQLFCRDSARDIVQMLLDECRAAKVSIKTGCKVAGVSKDKLFFVETNLGSFTAANLIIATGGLSFQKIGATGFGYEIAKQFGHTIVPTEPALVPLTLDVKDANLSKLAGISLFCVVTAKRALFRENLLFTHRGLSGPAILQISNYLRNNDSLQINLLPTQDIRSMLESKRDSRKLKNFLSEFLPARFVQLFFSNALLEQRLADLSRNEILEIEEKLHSWTVHVIGTEGFDKAEVTRGGVSTDKIDSKSMQSKLEKGLYFVGEVLAVTGWLGGYNFQWAWSSGFAAAISV